MATKAAVLIDEMPEIECRNGMFYISIDDPNLHTLVITPNMLMRVAHEFGRLFTQWSVDHGPSFIREDYQGPG